MPTYPTLRTSLLPALDAIRGIPTILGLRLHIVTVRIRQWTGERPGEGSYVDTNTGLKVDLAIGNVKVRNLTQKEVIASGGLFTDQDLIVGPITPPYQGSATDNDAISVFDPPTQVGVVSATEIFFNIQGPGYGATGNWFKKIGQRTDQPFRYMLYLRNTGEQFT
jgi:hypothetical protein